MAGNINSIQIMGNVGRVDVMTFQDGGKKATVTVATNKRWKDRNNEVHEETQWHTAVVNGATADFVEKYVGKGDLVHVTGEMKYRKYTGKDGADRTAAEIFCKEILLVSKQEEKDADDKPERAAAANPHLAELMDNGPDASEDLPF